MAEIVGIFPHWGQAPEPLWREVLGRRLRDLRADRDETLAQTAERAGISPQYLSEIERGRKEPSSEMIAALAGALDTTLADLTLAVTEDLRRLAGVGAGTRAALSRAAETRAAGVGRPAPTRSPAPPVALAMAA
ncbi:MAG TPA: helix-turn-helix transcriptional regulator [Trebonia sp.]|jgi:transcriptional regulator with XRE-family HTH domain|nr:helix-turn-helix transcriptional regulator [Trebonia sp.]